MRSSGPCALCRLLCLGCCEVETELGSLYFCLWFFIVRCRRGLTLLRDGFVEIFTRMFYAKLLWLLF